MNRNDQNQDPDMSPDIDRDLLSIRTEIPQTVDAEPPELMDQAILNMARRELHQRKRLSPRWVGAFATTAVLVVALTLVVQQQQQVPTPTGEPASSPAKVADEEVMVTGRTLKESFEPEKREESPTADSTGALSSSRSIRASASPAPMPQQEFEEYDSGFSDAENSVSEQQLPVTEPVADAMMEIAEPRLDMERKRLAPSTPKVSENEAALSPELQQWLDRLTQLKGDQQDHQFRLELEEFRTLYPDYPLPPEWED